MTTFLLIRHADNPLVGKAVAGWLPDIHLNEDGRKQAGKLAERLSGVAVRAIYSSPLERARETAAPLAERLRLPVHVSEALGEIGFGAWTGRELQDLGGDPEWQRFNIFRSSTRVPGGELMLEVQARMVTELERLREHYPEATLALVSHGDPIRATLAHYAGIPLDLFHRLEISPAAVSILRLHTDGAQILRMNDTGNLVEFT